MVASAPDFDHAFATMPLIAVLRGVRPEEVLDVADALVDAGFTLIEVPLNSPQAWTSIGRLVAHCPEHVIVGAGTVLQAAEAEQLGKMGARLMVTPNTDPTVIEAGLAAGLVPVVGCMTPSEALLAMTYGAAALKIFPAGRLGAGFAADLKAVLPGGSRLVAVGGIGEAEIAPYAASGYDGFGFGTSLYSAGRDPALVGAVARKLVAEWLRARQG